MSDNDYLQNHFIPVPKCALHRDEYGRILVSRAWMLEVVNSISIPVHEDLSMNRVPTDTDLLVPPAQWVFDVKRKTVTIGNFTFHLRGKCQFKLLHFVCSGKTSTIDAWRDVWGYDVEKEPIDYNTIRNTVRPVNIKLEVVKIPVKIEASKKTLKILDSRITVFENGEIG